MPNYFTILMQLYLEFFCNFILNSSLLKYRNWINFCIILGIDLGFCISLNLFISTNHFSRFLRIFCKLMFSCYFVLTYYVDTVYCMIWLLDLKPTVMCWTSCQLSLIGSWWLSVTVDQPEGEWGDQERDS